MDWKWSVFLLLALISAVLIGRGAQKASEVYRSGDSFAVTAWLRSSECARNTGKVLIICEGSKIFPIAEQDPGDDPGHALVLGIYAATTGGIVTVASVAVLNVVICTVGLFLLVGLLWRLDLRIAATVLLVFGPLISMDHQWIGPHAAQFGTTCLAMVPPIALATHDQKRHRYFWIAIALICICLASTFRQSSGMMSLVAVVLVAIYRSIRTPNLRTVLFCSVIVATSVVAYKTPSIISIIRNLAYHLDPTDMMETHGIWHNLYIGLGAVPNAFGIAWLDENGFNHAKSIDPHVVLLSKHYYDIMRQSYFDVVTNHPVGMLWIYIQKLWITITSNWLWLEIIVAGTVLIASLKGALPTSSRKLSAVMVISILFVVFFVVQAVLFQWVTVYIFPIYIPLIILTGASFQPNLAVEGAKAIITTPLM